MICEKCKTDTYSIYINANYQKLCAVCADEEEQKNQEPKEELSIRPEMKSSV